MQATAKTYFFWSSLSFVAALLACLITLSPARAQTSVDSTISSSTILIALQADKSTFITGEDLQVEVAIGNISGHDVTIPLPSESSIRIVVLDERGNTVKENLGMIACGPEPDPLLLRAGTVQKEIISLDLFGDTLVIPYGNRLKAGRYNARAYFDSHVSAPIEFIILAPGPEDRTVAEKLNRYYDMTKDPWGEIPALKSIIRDHPSSAYLPSAYTSLIILLRSSKDQQQRSEELLATITEFIDNYPTSPIVYSMLSSYIDGIRNSLGVPRRTKATAAAMGDHRKKGEGVRKEIPERTNDTVYQPDVTSEQTVGRSQPGGIRITSRESTSTNNINAPPHCCDGALER